MGVSDGTRAAASSGALLCGVLIALLGLQWAGLGSGVAQAAPPKLWEPDRCQTGEAAGQCRLPRGIAANPSNGRIFIADSANFRVVELNALGGFVKAWCWDVVASGPGDDTAAPEDEFEVCVPANGDSCKAGLQGGGSGQFAIAVDIGLDSAGNVYVADKSGNRRVQKFDRDGDFLLAFGRDVN